MKKLIIAAFALALVSRQPSVTPIHTRKEISKKPAQRLPKKDENPNPVNKIESTAQVSSPPAQEIHAPDVVKPQRNELPASFDESRDLNGLVLDAIQGFPKDGVYKADAEALCVLNSAIEGENGRLSISPELATPSFCSGATYLVFLSVIERLANESGVKMPGSVLDALMPGTLRDGVGVWGRWNANGPGTARLFHELQLGRNFTSFDEARAGDFMKVFWTDNIGAKEHGHSVIYLARSFSTKGEERIHFWSSNQPSGYGIREVPKSRIKRAVFSRLERPSGILALSSLPETDDYLASMQKRSCTEDEMLLAVGAPVENKLVAKSNSTKAVLPTTIRIGVKARVTRQNHTGRKSKSR